MIEKWSPGTSYFGATFLLQKTYNIKEENILYERNLKGLILLDECT